MPHTNPFVEGTTVSQFFKRIIQDGEKVPLTELAARFYPGVDPELGKQRVSNLIFQTRKKGFNVFSRKGIVSFEEGRVRKVRWGNQNAKKEDAPDQLHGKPHKTPQATPQAEVVSSNTDVIASRQRALQRALNLRMAENPAFVLEAIALMDNLIIQLMSAK